jgi:hypothetical protein
VVAGQAYQFTPTASDPDQDKVTFTITNKPAWAAFDFAAGRLSGTPTENDAGSYAAIEIAATDGKSVTALPQFTITVSRPDPAASAQAVTLEWEAPTVNTDGTPLTDLSGYRIHYGSAPGDYSASVAVNNPGLTRFVLDSLPAGKYYFALTAYNAAGQDSPYSPEVTATLN